MNRFMIFFIGLTASISLYAGECSFNLVLQSNYSPSGNFEYLRQAPQCRGVLLTEGTDINHSNCKALAKSQGWACYVVATTKRSGSFVTIQYPNCWGCDEN